MIPHGPLWSRMVVYGPVWSPAVLYGPQRSPMVLFGTLWSSIVNYGSLRSNMVPYGPDMVIYGPLYTPVWSSMFPYSIWPLASYGLIWSPMVHMVPYGPVRPFKVPFMVKCVPVWSVMVLFSTLWFCIVPYGCVWSPVVLYGPLWLHMVPYGFHGPLCFWSGIVP